LLVVVTASAHPSPDLLPALAAFFTFRYVEP